MTVLPVNHIRVPLLGLPQPRASRQGFSLIEALVTLVIIGLGVLAAAGLQIGARKGQQEAAQRTVASAAIQDLTERMLGNPNGRNTYIMALKTNPSADNGGPLASLGVSTTGGGIPNCSNAGACNPAAFATSDLGLWWAGLTGTNVTSVDTDPTPALDKPTVCLCSRSNATNDYRLTIAWRGAGPAGSFAGTDEKAGLTCGDTEAALYDDPDTPVPDVSLRRTISVRFLFRPTSDGSAPPSDGVTPCAAGL